MCDAWIAGMMGSPLLAVGSYGGQSICPSDRHGWSGSGRWMLLVGSCLDGGADGGWMKVDRTTLRPAVIGMMAWLAGRAAVAEIAGWAVSCWLRRKGATSSSGLLDRWGGASVRPPLLLDGVATVSHQSCRLEEMADEGAAHCRSHGRRWTRWVSGGMGASGIRIALPDLRVEEAAARRSTSVVDVDRIEEDEAGFVDLPLFRQDDRDNQ
ncbi:hypothetical protein ACLOJK_029390 [Asimina triloba]